MCEINHTCKLWDKGLWDLELGRLLFPKYNPTEKSPRYMYVVIVHGDCTIIPNILDSNPLQFKDVFIFEVTDVDSP